MLDDGKALDADKGSHKKQINTVRCNPLIMVDAQNQKDLPKKVFCKIYRR